MKINKMRIPIYLFIILLLIFLLYYSMTKPRVMVLQSYKTDYSWTANVDEGLRRIFSKHPYIRYRYHYMDTKNHPDEQFKKRAGIFARRIVEEWVPDVLVAIDDDAQKLVGKYFVNHPKIRIVFAGVNGQIHPYGYDKANNAAGIVERKPVSAIKEAFLKIAEVNKIGTKRKIKIYYIGDTSSSVKEDTEFIMKYNWEPLQMLRPKLVETYEQWKSAIREAGRKADFLLLGNHRKLKVKKEGKKLVDPKVVVEWTVQNCTIPGIGLNGFNVEDGYMFAIGPSPFEQGEVAAQTAIDILENKDPKSIPLQATNEFTVHIRGSGIKRYKLIIPKLYEAFARVANNYVD